MCYLVVRVSVYANIRTEPSVGEPNSHLARFLHQTKSQAQTAEKKRILRVLYTFGQVTNMERHC